MTPALNQAGKFRSRFCQRKKQDSAMASFYAEFVTKVALHDSAPSHKEENLCKTDSIDVTDIPPFKDVMQKCMKVSLSYIFI